MRILGFAEPFSGIDFGTFTGNKTMIRWFGVLNQAFGVEGRAWVFFKLQEFLASSIIS